MLATAFAPQSGLRESSRLPALSRAAGISAAELACLLACGAMAAIGVGFLHRSFQVPGHAILRGVLPISTGLALVPRRWAGIVMATGAGITSAAMGAVHFGTYPLPAMLSVLALGPVLDIALLGGSRGWRLYARFAGGGIVANLLALVLKVAAVQLGIEMGGGGQFVRFGTLALVSSYVLCGALAGLVVLSYVSVCESTMIYVGIDDTDTLDDPGTNQLARHLVRELAGQFNGRMILRHQLLEDPRVPCTKKNGCASILLEPLASTNMDRSPPLGGEGGAAALINRLRDLIIPWCPAGSDPGFCVATSVPPAVVAWGQRSQRELVTQQEARQIAVTNNIHLEGLGGTEDGVIGALAAVGLMATKNDGRIIYYGASDEDWYDVTGCLEAEDILARGVDEILTADTSQPVVAGTIDIGKRLRPNYRNGKIVLYVTRGELPHWEAVRVT